MADAGGRMDRENEPQILPRQGSLGSVLRPWHWQPLRAKFTPGVHCLANETDQFWSGSQYWACTADTQIGSQFSAQITIIV